VTNEKLITASADVVAAFAASQKLTVAELTGLLKQVHAALADLGKPEEVAPELVPAVSIRKSVTPDFLICLEDGKKYKSLKRHLRTTYGMTPDEYRAKWGLPKSYPMVAANYAASRSEMARSLGLGRKPAAGAVRKEPAPKQRASKARAAIKKPRKSKAN
jgi:predicted transcriptional regulator